MNVVHEAASEYVLKELLERNPLLAQFYRPDNSPGAKIADPNWIVRGDNGRISMQLIMKNQAVRVNVTFKVGQIDINFHTREVEVKPQPNSEIKILREVPRLDNGGVNDEEEYSVPLADPKSLQKTVGIVSDRISEIL